MHTRGAVIENLERSGPLTQSPLVIPLVALAALVVALLVLAAVLVLQADDEPVLPAYTVVGRAAWEPGARSGELTLIVAGRERVVAVDWSCYTAAVVGDVLPARVPFVVPAGTTAPAGATATCRAP